ncbi:MAG TPA: HAD-IIIA family hydrolase [Alphaproteobacteria bacterium]
MKQAAKPKLVMLDRDGTITEEIGRDITRPQDLHLIPRAGEAVALLNRAGIAVALVSNQEVVGRGEIDRKMLDRIDAKMRADLAAYGARLDAVFVCTDDPKHPSDRHKPCSGMLQEALARFRARPHQAPMIGDELSDLEAAARAGCPRHLVRTGNGAKAARKLPKHVLPVAIHKDLHAAVLCLLDGRRVSPHGPARRGAASRPPARQLNRRHAGIT